MQKTLALLLACIGALAQLPAADLPADPLPLTTERLQEPAAKRRAEQHIDCNEVNGTVSVTLRLDAEALKEALRGGRLQVLDIHLNAGRKSATNVGFALEGGTFHFTHMRFHRAQSDPIPATSSPSLEEFVQDKARVESVCGAVVTFVHASGQNSGPVAYGSYYYLDLYTPEGVVSFTGYAENLKVSDRRLGSVAIPEGSPAKTGEVFPGCALTPAQAAASHAAAEE